MSYYENHTFDKELPIIFHLDQVQNKGMDCASNWHENIEFLYCVEGEGQCISNSRAVEMKPGSVVLINSGDIHYTVTRGEKMRYYCLIIRSEFLQEFGMDVETIHFAEEVRGEEGQYLFERVIQEMEARLPYYKVAVKGEILSFVAWLCRNQPQESRSGGNDGMIKKGLQYIRNHFCENITVEEVAAYAGFSRFYFARQFKRITGMTVAEYVQFLRCRHARELLQEGDYTVSKAAMECGFSDVSYFTKVFKNQFGTLPSRIASEEGKE